MSSRDWDADATPAQVEAWADTLADDARALQNCEGETDRVVQMYSDARYWRAVAAQKSAPLPQLCDVRGDRCCGTPACSNVRQ